MVPTIRVFTSLSKPFITARTTIRAITPRVTAPTVIIVMKREEHPAPVREEVAARDEELEPHAPQSTSKTSGSASSATAVG